MTSVRALAGRGIRCAALAAVAAAGVEYAAARQEHAERHPTAGAPRTIVFGSDRNWPPYEFLDERGEPAGFNVDLVRAIGRALGIEVRIELGPWSEMRRRLEVEGTVDVSDMFYSEARDRVVDFAEPFTIVHDLVFTRRPRQDGRQVRTLEDLRGLRVLVQSGSFAEEALVASEVGAIPVPTETEPEALQRLAAGEEDAAIVTQSMGRYAIARFGLRNLASVGPPIHPRAYGFVVDEGRDDLRELLDRGLAIVRANGVFHELDAKWLAPDDDRFEWTRAWSIALALVALFALIALGALAWSRTLRRQVAQRTAELQAELQEHRRTAERLGAEARRSAGIVRTAMDGYFVIDEQGRIRDTNAAYCAMSGYSREELVGKPLAELNAKLSPEQVAEKVRYVLQNGRARFESTHRRKDGSPLELDVSASVFDSEDGPLFTTFVRDIGERRRLEEELRQSQKMEAVGRLAGGIAHDFNNLLTAIIGHADLLAEEHRLDEGGVQSAATIRAAADRAARLTQQLLAFSRKQILQPTVLDLDVVVAGMEELLRGVIGEDVVVRRIRGPERAWIEADRGQVEQVVLNLAVNARDAMPDGGTLTLTTGRSDGRLRPHHADLAPGQYVTLDVEDDGVGMSAEELARIFEPFFTTKPVGTGTGLGLSTVYGIVRQSGGEIVVESAPGAGSRFRIFLPYAREPEAEAVPADAPASQRGGETIMVVEDEESVRNLIRVTLERRGYTVLAAARAEEALELLDSRLDDVDLLLTDIVMPGLSGVALAGRFQEARPSGRVLYMTGYPDRFEIPHGARGQGVVMKPFSPTQLAVRVRSALDG